MLGKSSIQFSKFVTYPTSIEAFVNGRPLTTVNEDPSDFTPLTPAMFLNELPWSTYNELEIASETVLEEHRQLEVKIWSGRIVKRTVVFACVEAVVFACVEAVVFACVEAVVFAYVEAVVFAYVEAVVVVCVEAVVVVCVEAVVFACVEAVVFACVEAVVFACVEAVVFAWVEGLVCVCVN